MLIDAFVVSLIKQFNYVIWFYTKNLIKTTTTCDNRILNSCLYVARNDGRPTKRQAHPMHQITIRFVYATENLWICINVMTAMAWFNFIRSAYSRSIEEHKGSRRLYLKTNTTSDVCMFPHSLARCTRCHWIATRSLIHTTVHQILCRLCTLNRLTSSPIATIYIMRTPLSPSLSPSISLLLAHSFNVSSIGISHKS